MGQLQKGTVQRSGAPENPIFARRIVQQDGVALVSVGVAGNRYPGSEGMGGFRGSHGSIVRGESDRISARADGSGAMSTTQALAAGGAVAFGFATVLNAVFPAPPIEIHSLKYEDGYIIQDRTVNNGGERLPALYEAAIIRKSTGLPVCEGSGAWRYSDGHAVVRIPVSEWVGGVACKLSPGEYQPMATYETRGFSVTVRGDSFTVTE